MHFQEYWIRLHADVPASEVVVDRARHQQSSPRRRRGDHRRRPGDRAAVQPGRVGRPDPRGARDPRASCARPRHPVVGLSGIVGGDHVRGMARQLLGIHRRRGQRGRGGRALRRPLRVAGCSTAGWSTPSTPTWSSGSRRRASPAASVPLMMTDHDATADMAAAAVGLVRRMTPVAATRRCSRPTGSARSPRAPTWSPCSSTRFPTSPTATSSWSPARSSSKAEGRVRRRATREDAARRARPSGWSPAAARPRIVENHLGLVMAAAGDRRLQRRGRHGGAAAPRPRRQRAGAADRRCSRPPGTTSPSLVTDTAGRAWRHGPDRPRDRRGRHRGRSTTTPAASTATATRSRSPPRRVADELAGAADLVKGKLGGRPVAVVRGLGGLVLPRRRRTGPARASLVRPARRGHVRLGAREAVVAALAGEPPTAFGAPAPTADLRRRPSAAGRGVTRDGRACDSGRPTSPCEARARQAHGRRSPARPHGSVSDSVDFPPYSSHTLP